VIGRVRERGAKLLATVELAEHLAQVVLDVRGLMTSWAPISGSVCPSRANRDLDLLGRQGVAVIRRTVFAGGEQLAAGTLGERCAPPCG
jgi:hypothetical protein